MANHIKLPCVESRDVADAFGLAVYEVARGWRAKVEEKTRRFGLSNAASLAVWSLASSPKPLTQSELARRCFVEGPSMARLIDRLEAKGWVSRADVPGDRRKNHVLLTEKCLPYLEEMVCLARGVRDDLLQGIPEDQLSGALDVLRLIRSRLGE